MERMTLFSVVHDRVGVSFLEPHSNTDENAGTVNTQHHAFFHDGSCSCLDLHFTASQRCILSSPQFYAVCWQRRQGRSLQLIRVNRFPRSAVRERYLVPLDVIDLQEIL